MVGKAERDRLLAQVRELPPGDFVLVHTTRGSGESRFERLVDVPHGFPVWLKVGHCLEREPGVTVRVCEGRNERGRRDLAGGASHGCARHIDGVYSSAAGREQCCQLATCRVVRVQVNREVETLAQRRDELLSGPCAQKTGHVLDRDDVRTGVNDLLREAQVVVEGVQVFCGVEQVAGVAERNLGHGGSRGEHGIDGGAHLGHIVERIEDPEDVDTGRGGFADKRVGDLGRVGGVPHSVAATEQHLDIEVRQRLAQ